jgi:hypothetical protein
MSERMGLLEVMRCEDTHCYISEEKGSFLLRRNFSRGLEFI